MTAKRNQSILHEKALELGAHLFGTARTPRPQEARSRLPKSTLQRLPYAVSIGVRLSNAVIEDIIDHPTRLYLHHYRQVNYRLDRIALALADFIETSTGHLALPIAASQVIDWKEQRAHLSHKHVARQAGLGWIGRNNLLVHPHWGSRLRLVTILTELPLQPGQPTSEDCSECHRCINVCPAGAIGEDPADFDHLACYEHLQYFRQAYNIGHTICGICVKACQPASTTEAADHG